MARFRTTLTAIVLGGAAISHPAKAQHSASVSLTHIVTVTVPPRVKVQVAGAPVPADAVRSSRTTASGGLALTVSATQAWSLSVAAPAPKSRLEWSRDGGSATARVTDKEAVIASGSFSQIPSATTVVVRPALAIAPGRDARDSDTVVFTVVAQ